MHTRRTLIALLVAIAPLALAQVEDDAAALLRCAAERHGAQDQTLVSVFDRSSITYYGPGGVPAAILDVESVVDVVERRLRATFSVAGDVVLIQQLTGDSGFTDTPQTGPVPLPPSERATLAQAFVTGIAGVRLGDQRDSATVVPDTALGDERRDAIAVVSDGVEHVVFLDDDCTLIAEVTTDPQVGELLTYYLDYRDLDGWWLPFAAEVYLGGERFASIETLEGRVNDALVDELFETP